MYRARLQKSLTSTLSGVYTLSGGVATRTSEAIDVSFYDTFAVQVGYDTEVGTPKLRVQIEGSTDNTIWSVIKHQDDFTALNEKRVTLEHPNKWVRVKLTIIAGTSINVASVNAEAIT